MSKESSKLLELAFVLVAHNHNPSLLNPDFLRFNDIVPRDWETSAPPICAGPIAQVVFKEGITIVSQPDRVSFAESMLEKKAKTFRLPNIVKKYVETLPHVDYRQVGFNPKAFIPAKEKNDILVSAMMADGPWKSFKGIVPSASVNLTFRLSDYTLSIGFEEGLVEIAGQKTNQSVICSANFHRELQGQNQIARKDQLLNTLPSWESDYAEFDRFIDSCFVERLSRGAKI